MLTILQKADKAERQALIVANQCFSVVTAQRAILPANAREGGLSKSELRLLSECVSTVRASATCAVLSVCVIR